MKQNQDWLALNSGYGPDNPEPPQLKDSTKSKRQELNALHAVEEYLQGKN